VDALLSLGAIIEITLGLLSPEATQVLGLLWPSGARGIGRGQSKLSALVRNVALDTMPLEWASSTYCQEYPLLCFVEHCKYTEHHSLSSIETSSGEVPIKTIPNPKKGFLHRCERETLQDHPTLAIRSLLAEEKQQFKLELTINRLEKVEI
jgi:hypothetical protein